MATETVKWFNKEKGYGFIVPDAGGSDIFVHYGGISGEASGNLLRGREPSSRSRQGRKGPQATNVRRLAH